MSDQEVALTTAYLLTVNNQPAGELRVEAAKETWPVVIVVDDWVRRRKVLYVNCTGEERAWFGQTCPVYREVPAAKVLTGTL